MLQPGMLTETGLTRAIVVQKRLKNQRVAR